MLPDHAAEATTVPSAGRAVDPHHRPRQHQQDGECGAACGKCDRPPALDREFGLEPGGINRRHRGRDGTHEAHERREHANPEQTKDHQQRADADLDRREERGVVDSGDRLDRGIPGLVDLGADERHHAERRQRGTSQDYEHVGGAPVVLGHLTAGALVALVNGLVASDIITNVATAHIVVTNVVITNVPATHIIVTKIVVAANVVAIVS
ncbi:MAG: hypothetical protein ACRD07_08285 [Acidimicrobiales bacterium]